MNKIAYRSLVTLVGFSLLILPALPFKVSFAQISTPTEPEAVPSEAPTSTEPVAPPDLNRAERETKKGEYREAIKEFNQALRLNRNDANAYFNRGSLYILTRDYKKATENLQQAAKLFSEQGNTVLHQQALRQLELIGDIQKP